MWRVVGKGWGPIRGADHRFLWSACPTCFGKVSSARHHETRFGVLDEFVHRSHIRDRQALGAIEIAALEEIGLDERPDRIGHQMLEADWRLFGAGLRRREHAA